MRRILVDAARVRASAKRGGGLQRVDPATTGSLDALPAAQSDRADEIAALDDALNVLAKRDPRRVQVIELRYLVD